MSHHTGSHIGILSDDNADKRDELIQKLTEAYWHLPVLRRSRFRDAGHGDPDPSRRGAPSQAVRRLPARVLLRGGGLR